MASLKRAIFIVYLFSQMITGMASEIDSIAITYIANCGYLIEANGQKIIVDGLFKLGHNKYPVPDSETLKLLETGQNPFNDVDLIMVTHTHEDHFDSGMVTGFMLNNKTAKLVCPQQVADEIAENKPAYDKIKDRIISCTPEPFISQEINIGNINVNACRFAHPGERHKDVQNIAYLISVGGKSVFHSADIDPAQIEKYTGIKINEMNIDIALMNEDFAKIENAALTREFINAQTNIAMHLPDPVAAVWFDSLKDQPGLFSNPFIFTKQLDKKVFYIHQKQ